MKLIHLQKSQVKALFPELRLRPGGDRELTLAVGEAIPYPSPAAGRGRRHHDQQWGCSVGWLGQSYVTCQGWPRAPSLLPPNLTHFPTAIRASFFRSPSLPASLSCLNLCPLRSTAQSCLVLHPCILPRILCAVEMSRAIHSL